MSAPPTHMSPTITGLPWKAALRYSRPHLDMAGHLGTCGVCQLWHGRAVGLLAMWAAAGMQAGCMLLATGS
jgi:hypothetical protein